MKGSHSQLALAGLLAPFVLAATVAGAQSGYTRADVRFMQRMIGHHAQALAMTSLVPARSTSESIRLIAGRIDVSQRDEIALMRRWLSDHHEEVPEAEAARHEHHAGMDMSGRDALMPGMLTSEELDRLAKASGAAFDQLFLQYMIRHHQGALTMVSELFAVPGAGQAPEIFRFASDVDADQRAEIARMRTLTR
jgi:uncharacterized protein (DUF305 family)